MEIPVERRRGVSYDKKARQLSPRAEVARLVRVAVDATLPRKVPQGVQRVTVPQTDTGGRGENPKALERTLVKELCNLPP